MEYSSLISYLLIIPFAGAFLLLLINKRNEKLIRYAGLAASLLTFIISLVIYFNFDDRNSEFQFVHKFSWIENLNIFYFVGIDGLSLLLVLLTTFITPLTLISSWSSIASKVKEFTFFMLMLEVGMLGVFVSLDLFLFYIFWEAMLIPMYFIIGIWGGKERIYASIKFFIYTMFGSLLMLVAIIWLAIYASAPLGYFTTSLPELYSVGPQVEKTIQDWMFLAFAFSFAIKVPLFPLHTWLPDAHVQAPTAGSVILAGVLLKMGTYGLLRFCLPLFPQASITFAPYISVLAVTGIIYGALVAMVQKDMKKLVAYSSVAHLGFVVLGIFAMTQEAVQGGILQMVNHGISTGALFLLVGILYERRHTRLISEYGGLSKVVSPHAPPLDGAPRAERLRRGAPHHGGGVPADAGAHDRGGQRGHLRGGLHALDVPAGDVRHDHEREEPAPAGHECAGGGLHAPPPRVRLLDRRLPPDVPAEDGRLGCGPRGADRDETPGGAGRLSPRRDTGRPLLRRYPAPRFTNPVAFKRRCIRSGFVALLAPYRCGYASVARLAGAAPRRSRFRQYLLTQTLGREATNGPFSLYS